MLFNHQGRRAVKEVEKHWISNLWIRSVIIVLDIICIVIFATLQIPGQFYWWCYIGLSPSFVWTVVVLIYRFSRVKPIHPGAHVGCELTTWVAVMVTDIFAWIFVTSDSPWLNRPYYAAPPPSPGVWAANVVCTAMMMVLVPLHFYLFVRACIDTSRRRSHDIATQAASMAAQMVKDMEKGESRHTVYRRDSRDSFPYSPSEIPYAPSEASHHILGLEELQRNEEFRGSVIGLEEIRPGLLLPIYSSRMSEASRARSGRTRFSQARTQYSHARSLSVPVPTSPRSLRTARTDEPSLFRLAR